jgi:hypothetical protein
VVPLAGLGVLALQTPIGFLAAACLLFLLLVYLPLRLLR